LIVFNQLVLDQDVVHFFLGLYGQSWLQHFQGCAYVPGKQLGRRLLLFVMNYFRRRIICGARVRSFNRSGRSLVTAAVVRVKQVIAGIFFHVIDGLAKYIGKTGKKK
jgi:hypothetical protein